MQKHKVPAFRLFFLAGSGAAQEEICYCFWLPALPSQLVLEGGGPLPPPLPMASEMWSKIGALKQLLPELPRRPDGG